ncbi:hypothetical protein GCM10027598_59490 [Amycolatopsis oliviviridis]|uniref:Uncharacterized protein n=1 Tax=Amycolatopsis oliviviridis TaxID=1471590 RepID=A0ABQ3LXR9_9PSEU|nr:hypothetical protein GCM10017790_60140 [Amycolatopsis oliviviridis]
MGAGDSVEVGPSGGAAFGLFGQEVCPHAFFSGRLDGWLLLARRERWGRRGVVGRTYFDFVIIAPVSGRAVNVGPVSFECSVEEFDGEQESKRWTSCDGHAEGAR